jgi:hypothetical protein
MLWWTIQQLRSSSADTRAAAASKLGGARTQRALGPLCGALSDTDSYVRLKARESLDRMDPGWRHSSEARRAVLGLIEALQHPDEKVRWASAEALGWVGDPRAVEALDSTAHRDISPHVRRGAIWALSRFEDDRIVGLLVALLRHDQCEVAAYHLHWLNWDPPDATVRRLFRSALCYKALSVEFQCTSCFGSLGGGARPGLSSEEEMVLSGLTLKDARAAEQAAGESALYRGQICIQCMTVLCYKCQPGGVTTCPTCGQSMRGATGKSLDRLKGIAFDALREARVHDSMC